MRKKMILTAVAVSVCMAGTAFAHVNDEGNTKGEMAQQEQQAPESNKNAENAGEKEAPFEYKIGVNGFLRGEGEAISISTR